MKVSIAKLREMFFLAGFRNPGNAKKLCFVAGFSNIFTCAVFFSWFLVTKSQPEDSRTFTAVASLIFALHIYLNLVLVNWSLGYEESKLSKWVWLSLVFVFPFGLGLIFSAAGGEGWTEAGESRRSKKSIFHSLTNSLIHISENLSRALKYLNEHHGEEIREFLRIVELPEDTEIWPIKAKFLIIAHPEALRQNRKKNTFEDVVFHAHWYDGRRFDFAIKDPKSKIMHTKHKYSMAFLVLDEVNNYQKILDFKREIKENIKFGPAKAICLHWGKGFKFYVNA